MTQTSSDYRRRPGQAAPPRRSSLRLSQPRAYGSASAPPMLGLSQPAAPAQSPTIVVPAKAWVQPPSRQKRSTPTAACGPGG